MARWFQRHDHRGERVFVLAGGGNLGAAQSGQLLELLKAGIVPDRIIGCSVGALNGTFIALEPTVARAVALVDIWKSGKVKDVFATTKLSIAFKIATKSDHLVDPMNLRRLIKTEIGVELLEQTKVPVEVLATSLSTGRERWFERGPVIEVLCASTALPGVFPPVHLDGELYVDGGVISPCPVGRAYLRKPAEVWILDTPERPWELPAKLNALEVLIRSFYVACRETDHQPEAPDRTRVFHLRTKIPEHIHLGFNDFNDFEQTGVLINAGEQSVQEALKTMSSNLI